MKTPEEREQESRESDETKFQEAREDEKATRERVAEEIRDEPPLTDRD